MKPSERREGVSLWCMFSWLWRGFTSCKVHEFPSGFPPGEECQRKCGSVPKNAGGEKTSEMQRMLLNCFTLNVVVVIMYFPLLIRRERIAGRLRVLLFICLTAFLWAVFCSSYMILLAQRELCSLTRPFAETGHKAFCERPGPVFDLIMKCKYTEP